MTGIAGIVQKSFGQGIGQLSNADYAQEVVENVSRQDQVEASWLDGKSTQLTARMMNVTGAPLGQRLME